MTFYTYTYLRADGTPYYIGKGKDYRAFKNGGRPCKKPIYHSRILIQYWKSEEKAFEMEVWWINFWGRKDNGTGILRNLSDGGAGKAGFIPDPEQGRKHSKFLKDKFASGEMGPPGAQSIEARKKLSTSLRAGHASGEIVTYNKGIHATDEQKAKWWTPERRAAQAERCRKMAMEVIFTPERRAALAAAAAKRFKGIPQSEEQKTRAREGWKKAWTPERKAARSERAKAQGFGTIIHPSVRRKDVS
jgi:hypothetical protein